MLNEYQRLESEIADIQTQLKTFPAGNFFCTHNENRYKWYRTDGQTQTYIPKKNRPLAEKLATKKYLSLRLKDLIHEKNAIAFYLRHHATSPSSADKLLTNNPEYQRLITPYFKSTSEEINEWLLAPYEKNEKYPEQLIQKSISGNLLRSKSESLIDMLLFINKVPFRYECALQLGSVTIYPDFTIKHPSTGQIYYWEHFGRMDDPLYSKNVFPKLQQYTNHGIIPSIQLITTYETLTHPISSEEIENIIKQKFL